MFAPEAIEETVSYFFYQIVSLLTTFTENMNAQAVTLFDQPFVGSITEFFQMLAGGLAIVGALFAIFECVISYQDGSGAPVQSTVINLVKTWFAVMLFATIPIQLYKLSVDLYGTVSGTLIASAAPQTSIWTILQGYAQDTLKRFMKVNPVFNIGSTVWDFLAGLTGSASQPFILDWMLIIQLIIVMYVFIKVFFGNLKRGAIMLIMICTGSLHMLSLPRGFADGFTAWMKQVVALCFTVFMQNILFTLGILMSKDEASLYLAVGLLLAAAEVPRIAQMFGLDTSSKANLGGAMHTASSAFMVLRMVR